MEDTLSTNFDMKFPDLDFNFEIPNMNFESKDNLNFCEI
jgi:hypothetical protein